MTPFVGQIHTFGFNFAPRGWAFCNGALLPIAQNTALFSLLGTAYGGDGRTTFGLPDLQGRLMMHEGTGPGLPTYRLGQKIGSETNTLSLTQLPGHTHVAEIPASNAVPGSDAIAQHYLTNQVSDTYAGAPTAGNNYGSGSITTGSTGGGQSIDNVMPSLAMNVCIALVGTYPSRS